MYDREKKNVDSIGYLYFKNENYLNEFKSGFEGHTFILEKGREKKAEIEFAPFQKIPKSLEDKPDPKYANTIEKGLFLFENSSVNYFLNCLLFVCRHRS